MPMLLCTASCGNKGLLGRSLALGISMITMTILVTLGQSTLKDSLTGMSLTWAGVGIAGVDAITAIVLVSSNLLMKEEEESIDMESLTQEETELFNTATNRLGREISP